MSNKYNIKPGDRVRLVSHGSWDKLKRHVGEVFTVQEVFESTGDWYIRLKEVTEKYGRHSRCIGDVVPAREASTEQDPNGVDAHTPGAKLDAGKVLAGEILSQFPRALTGVAEVGTFGAQKYTMGGWLQVPNAIARYANAQLRHWLARAKGEKFDKDSKLHHLKHEAWNALAVLELTLQEEEKANG